MASCASLPRSGDHAYDGPERRIDAGPSDSDQSPMNTLRRGAPLAVFAVLAGSWAGLNYSAANGAEANRRAADEAFRTHMYEQTGRLMPPPAYDLSPSTLATVTYGLALLVGVTLLAVVLRRSSQRPLYLVAAVGLLAGGGSVDISMLWRAAGEGVAAYTSQGLYAPIDLSAYVGPQWLLWAAGALGAGAVLLPVALMGRPAETNGAPSLRHLIVLGLATAVVALAGQAVLSMGSGAGAGLLECTSVGLAAALAAVALRRTARRRQTAGLLFVGLALIALAVPSARTTGDVLRALLLSAFVVGAGALPLVPWAALRTRLNTRLPPAPAASA